MSDSQLLDDDSNNDEWQPPPGFKAGAVPRDYNVDPVEMFADPSGMPLIPRSEWDARIDEQERLQSSLEHVRLSGDNGQPIRSLDQNGQGYCWAYSVTATVMLARAAAFQPHVRLSAHAVGCKVKGFRDKGGWCGLSAKFIRENGIPSVAFWPEKSMSRSHDNAATWDDARQRIITEDWVDLTRPVWGQNLTFDQVATCLLLNVPCALDFNHWGHSVCGLRLVRVEAGSYGIKIWNSWTDGWKDRGMAVLRGQKAVPDGAVATRTTRAT